MLRRWLVAVVALAVVALVLRPWRDAGAPPQQRPVTQGDPPVAGAPAHRDEHAARQTADAPPTPASADAAVTTRGLTMRVRLRGLHAQAPWTAPLQLSCEARGAGRDDRPTFHAERTPTADGRATLPLPDWCTEVPALRLRVSAHDPHYQPLALRRDTLPDLPQELVVDVQVVATLTGRVLAADRQPIAAARVVAFAWRDGQPVEPALAHANTRRDGTFTLPVPPDTPLWLLAAAMQPMGPRSKSGPLDGSEPDNGLWRADLLPASRRVVAAPGAAVAVDDFVLATAAQVTGTVRWTDGAAVAGAVVQSLPRDGSTLPLAERALVVRTDDGRLLPGARATTGDDGAFVLPAAAGSALDVAVTGLADVHLVGALQQPAVAPQRVDLVVPRPLVLRATDGARGVARATVEIGDHQRLAADADGAVHVVAARPLRARALHERMRSPWCDVPLAAAGTTVELPMRDERVELAIEFAGEFRVRNTVVSWRRDDGAEGREHLLRDDRAGPFQLFLEPGRYHVVAGPGGGERNGVFLLPVAADVELDLAPRALTLAATFGGSFTVMATDSGGVWVAGHCQVLARDGRDVTDRFEVHDGGTARSGIPGELLADGTNRFLRVLPAGDYELLADFGARGAVRQIVTVRPREITEVRLRLP